MIVKTKPLLCRFIIWFYWVNSLVFLLIGSSYLKAILCSRTLLANALVTYDTVFAKSVILLFAILNYVSYMMLLAFIPACVLLLFVMLVPTKRLTVVLSVFLAIVSLLFLIVDSQVYSMFKFHLNATYLSMIFNENALSIFDFSSREFSEMLGVTALVIVFETALACFVWHKLKSPRQSFKVEKRIFWTWLVAFIACYMSLIITMGNNLNILNQQTPNLPLFNQVYSYLIPAKNAGDLLLRYSENYYAQPLFSKDQLNYPLHAMQCKKPKHPYNIILIMVDAFRADNLNKQLTPHLSHFAENHWNFLQHYSGGNATQPGLFSLFYSIPGSYWTAVLEQKKSSVFVDLLKKNNYKSRVIWSSIMRSPPFDKTIYLGLKNLSKDSEVNPDVGDSDRRVTRQAIDYLIKNGHEKPFFLNLFYNAAHASCQKQSFPSLYSSSKKPCSRITFHNNLDPKPYYNRYLNAVTFVDGEIGKVLASIESNGYLKDSIVIITSDHGEEFNDTKQDYWGHACNFTRYQAQVPLIIHWPGQLPHQFTYLTTGYDLMPTLFKNLFACKNPTMDYSIGQNLLKERGRLPFELMVSYVNIGIVEVDRITTLQASGQIVVTDPNAVLLPNATPKKEVIKQAMHLMRQYFL